MKSFLTNKRFALILKIYTVAVLIFMVVWSYIHGFKNVNSVLKFATILITPAFILTAVRIYMKKH